MTEIPRPLALWLGPSAERWRIKTACGLAEWLPGEVLCQVTLRETSVFVDDPRLPCVLLTDDPTQTAEGLARIGVRTVVCCDNRRPYTETSLAFFHACLEAGLHVASGSHARLHDAIDRMTYLTHPDQVHDVRYADREYPLGTGERRAGLRLLTVGPDSALGKKYTALSIARALGKRWPSTFCATGQTGRLLCGPDDRWICLDTTPVDFAAGAAEWLSPVHADPGHWHVIEGQANAWHPAWGPLAVALLYGSAPSALVYCAVPGRQRLVGLPGCHPLPDPVDDILRHLELCDRMGYGTELVAISVNASECTERREHQRFTERVTRAMLDKRIETVPIFNPSAREADLGLGELVDDLVRWGELMRATPPSMLQPRVAESTE